MMDEGKAILVVDDDVQFRESLMLRLSRMGHECLQAGDGEEASSILRVWDVDVVMTDLRMPGMDGMQLLHWMAGLPMRPITIVLTAHGDTAAAVEATHLGAYDFVTKPVDTHRLEIMLARALEHQRLQRQNDRLARQSDHLPTLGGMVGKSAPMLEVFRTVMRVAPTGANILITGESGTGKEHLAKAIHERSARSAKPFVVIDCATIPETLFESVLFGHRKGAFTGARHDHAGLISEAHGGTAFFDEVGELPLPMQAKLLRVIQEGSYLPVGDTKPKHADMRIVAATNRDLLTEVQSGQFREDLYYRLNVVHIAAPPLRDRGSDIDELAFYFLDKVAGGSSQVVGISPEALTCLRGYGWPGNVRELHNAIERGAHMARTNEIQPEDLPPHVQAAGTETLPAAGQADQQVERWEDCVHRTQREYLMALLIQNAANISRASAQAGVSRKTLYKMLKDVRLDPSAFRHT